MRLRTAGFPNVDHSARSTSVAALYSVRPGSIILYPFNSETTLSVVIQVHRRFLLANGEGGNRKRLSPIQRAVALIVAFTRRLESHLG